MCSGVSKLVVLLTIAAVVVLLTQCACRAQASSAPDIEHACCTPSELPVHSDETPGCRHCDTSASPVPDSIHTATLELVCVARIASTDEGRVSAVSAHVLRARPPDPVSVQTRFCILLT